jgi:hypothetical protein
MAHQAARPTPINAHKQPALTGTGAGPAGDLQPISTHPVLQLQRLVGNRAMVRALGRDRRVAPAPVRPALLPVTSLSLIQRQPDNLMSAEELEKLGGKPKSQKGGPGATLYSKILQELTSIGSMKEKSGAEYVGHIEDLQSHVNEWRTKYRLRYSLSKSKLLGWSAPQTRAVRALETQLTSKAMQEKLNQEKAKLSKEEVPLSNKEIEARKKQFWEAINDPQAQAKQQELEKVLPSIREAEDKEKIGAGSSNWVYKVNLPTQTKVKGSNQSTIKSYAYRTNIHTFDPKTFKGTQEEAEPKQKQALRAKKEYDRSVYLPLLARALGIKTVAQSAQAKGRRGRPEAVSEFAKGQSLLKILESGKTPTGISDEDFQENMLFDMVFQAGDPHVGNYMLGEEGGVKRLKRIDVDAVFNTTNPWFVNKPAKEKQQIKNKYRQRYMKNKIVDEDPSIARAGSALAGLPQANRLLNPKVIDKIKKWNPQAIRKAMENTPGSEGRNTFDKEQIDKVVANILSIQNLVGANKKLSARELFNEYNREQATGFDEQLMTLDKLLPKMKLTTADRYLFYNTGLVPFIDLGTEYQFNKESLYGKLGHLEKSETKEYREAMHSRFRQKPAPKPPVNPAPKSSAKGILSKPL